jgi:c(7)-type cytochrome triheme protein
VIPNHPWIQQLQEYGDTGQEIPWQKVTYLPDHAFFSHQEHLSAGVACADCHGQVEQMDRIWEIQPLQMGFCIDCHKIQERSTAILDCANCHQ